jgi:hypothetical protein
MPHSVEVVRTSDFVRFGGNKKVDLVQTRRSLMNIAKLCVDLSIDCALLDIREMSSDLTPVDLYELATAFPEMGFHKGHKLAILHRASGGERVEFFAMNPAARAEFFAACAADAGWQVKAFDDYEEAMDWFAIALPVAE